MAIFLGHTTPKRIFESRLALDVDLERVPLASSHVPQKSELLRIARDAFGVETLDGFMTALQLDPHEALDVIVPSQEHRRCWSGIKAHVLPSRVSRASFCQLSEDIMVACPALCLLQCANELDLIGTIKLAMSLCGIYRLTGDNQNRSIFSRKPLLAPDEAESFLVGLDGVHGVKTMRQALRYTLPNSGSPKETEMVLPLYLPRRLGGFGLPKPEMNAVIPLDDHAAAICGSRSVVCDALWRNAYTAFEYQSREHHDNQRAYGHDYARQLALESMGYVVKFVTNDQLRSIEQMTELARILAARAGIRMPKDAFAPSEKRIKLLGCTF